MSITDEMVRRARYAYMQTEGLGKDKMRAALTAAIGGGVVVPREPTDKMLESIELSLWKEVLMDRNYAIPSNSSKLLYRAMPAAAWLDEMVQPGSTGTEPAQMER